jgi:ATP-dependent RNA helicase RhlB
MFDMGFYPDLRKLIKVVPPADKRQTMLFSATLNAWVKNLAWEYTKTPCEIEIAPETVTVDEVEQVLYHVPSPDKMRLLMGILQREQPESALIFCNTKRYAEIIAMRMNTNGYDAQFIIGDLPQQRRLKIIEDIKAGDLRYLVATDVAARGLDSEGLALVVNYDLPNEAENYVHRIGRTARAGKTGKAISFCSEQDVYELPSIEKYIGKKIPSENAVEELFAEDKSAGMRMRTEFADDRGRDGRGSGGSRRGDGGGFRRGESRDPGRRRESSESRRGEGRGGEGWFSGESRGGEGRGNSRPGDSRGAGGEGRSDGRPERSRPGRSAQADRPPRGEGSGSQTGRGSSQDLSKLSLEERMAYYRQKYDQPESSSAGPAPKAAEINADRRGGRDGGERNAGRRGRSHRGGRRNRPEGRQNADGGRDGGVSEGKRAGNTGAAITGTGNGGASGKAGAGNKKPSPAKNNREPGRDSAGKAAEPGGQKKGILSKLLGVFKKK